ncbi:MAG: hypothetical protein K2J63_03575 [Muribaculaceae bacterium]|nr:hypothetical protein [Muribaculaceae bacterium]
MNDVNQYIEKLYQDAQANGLLETTHFDISDSLKSNIDIIVENAENSKGVMTVALTSLIYKGLNPDQDIRKHQASIPGGYAGRIFDAKYITPFLRSKSFPCMAESGWLTRSLEQKHPYDAEYPGAIKPRTLKCAFLGLLEEIQAENTNIREVSLYFLHRLIILRDSKTIEIAKPKNLSINTIIDVLAKHFKYSYHSRGASRLPVLALYAIYQLLIEELKRFNAKTLLPLENHTSADSQSGRLGDIDITDEDGNSFETVEVKFDVSIGKEIVERAKEKIQPSSVTRYYILSTASIKKGDESAISQIITQIKNTHGCQIVVNGIVPTLKYYLRLVEKPSDFIEKYARLLASDETIKFEHKEAWNNIISKL